MDHRGQDNHQLVDEAPAVVLESDGNLKRNEVGDSFAQFLEDERTIMSTGGQRPTRNSTSVDEETVIILDTPIAEKKDIVAQAQMEERMEETIDVNQTPITTNTAINPQVINSEKTNAWIRSTEFITNSEMDYDTMKDQEEIQKQPYQRKTENYNDRNNNLMSTRMADEDKTLSELLNQVAELDEIYTDHQIRRNMLIERELASLDHSLLKSRNLEEDNMDVDELFDDAATYTSLQKAFKNPIDLLPPVNDFDAVEPLLGVLNNPLGPVIDVSPLKRENVEEEKLPPLPPKRKRPPNSVEDSPSSNKENKGEEIVEGRLVLADGESIGLGSNFNNSRRSSTKSTVNRPPSQIIIMKSPESGGHSAPTKCLPPTPNLNHSKSSSTSRLNSTRIGSTASLPKQKKPGFFSKLFSRRKSKNELADSKSMEQISNRNGTVSPTSPARSSDDEFLGPPPMDASRFSNRSLKVPTPIHHKAGRPVGRSVSSVSGKRPNMTPDIVHIPLKGDSTNSLNDYPSPFRSHHTSPKNISSYSIADDRKAISALQLADLPLQEGNMELIAIADAQSLKNLCEGQYGVQLDPSVDLTEAEHYALYTSVAPRATTSEFDEMSAYYAPVESGHILTPAEVASRLKSGF